MEQKSELNSMFVKNCQDKDYEALLEYLGNENYITEEEFKQGLYFLIKNAKIYSDLSEIIIQLISKLKHNYPNKYINIVNYCYEENKVTLLMLASKIGSLEIVQELLNCGANIAIKDKQNQTAIYYAVDNCQQNVDLIRILLQSQNYNEQFKNIDLFTSFIKSIEYGHAAIVKILVTKDSTLLIQNKEFEGLFPLQFSLKQKEINISKYLVKKGASIFKQNSQKKSSLDFCDDEDLKQELRQIYNQRNQKLKEKEIKKVLSNNSLQGQGSPGQLKKKLYKTDTNNQKCDNLESTINSAQFIKELEERYKKQIIEKNAEIEKLQKLVHDYQKIVEIPKISIETQKDQTRIIQSTMGINTEGNFKEIKDQKDAEISVGKKISDNSKSIDQWAYESILQPSDIFEELSREIRKFMNSVDSNNQKMKKTIDELINNTKQTIQDAIPNAEIFIYGSYETDLFLAWSDIDIVVKVPKEFDASYAFLLSHIDDHFKTLPWIKESKNLTQASTPVLKLTTTSVYYQKKIDITIQDQFHYGIKSAAFVKKCIEQFKTLRPLVLVMKEFIFRNGIYDTYNVNEINREDSLHIVLFQ